METGTSAARALAWPTAPPRPPSPTSGRRSGAPGWPRVRRARRRRGAGSRPDLRRHCNAAAAERPPPRRPSRAGLPAGRTRCSRRPTPAVHPSRSSAVSARSSGAPFLHMVQDAMALPGLEQLITRLAQRVARHQLGTVRGEPGGIVTRWAPAAGIEGAAAVGAAEQSEVGAQRGGQRLRFEPGGAKQPSRLGPRLGDMIPQRLHGGSADRRLLTPAGDEGAVPPRGSAEDTPQLEEVAPLGLGQRDASMDAELGDVEPDLAELAHHQDLEVLRRQLRQLGHRSVLLRRGRYDAPSRTARPRKNSAGRGVARSQPRPYIIRQSLKQLRAPHLISSAEEHMLVGRRDFLRLTASAGAGTAIGGLVGLGVTLAPAAARAQELRIKDAKTTPSICPFCSVGCATLIHTVDGKLVNMTPAIFALGGATLDNEFNHVCQKFWRGLGVVAIENQARI